MKYKFSLIHSPVLFTILIYLFVNLIIFSNVLIFKSSVIGILSSIIYVYISSVLCGNIFKDEVSWEKLVFGFSVFIIILSLGGAVALLLYVLTPNIIIILLSAITASLIVLNVKKHDVRTTVNDEHIEGDEKSSKTEEKRKHSIFNYERIYQALYACFLCLSVAFLLLSRSGEVSFVLNAIHPLFFPSYFVATLFLLLILLSRSSKRVKLVLIVVHAFMIHSLLIIVLNPGFYGDQWSELGLVRDIDNFGKNLPNLMDFLFGGTPFQSPFMVIYFSFRKRVYQALVVIFANMFGVDDYWSHLFLVPVLWAIFTTFFTYKILKILGEKENYAIFGGLLTLAVPMLIWYGAVSVPESLGAIFFCMILYLSLKYSSSIERKTSLLFLMFIVSLVAFSTHFKSGVLAVAVLMLSLFYKEYKVKLRGHVSWVELIPAVVTCSSLLPLVLFGLYGVYPEAGYMHVSFSLQKIADVDILALFFGEYVNLTLKELLLKGLITLLGIMGLIYTILYAPKRAYNRILSMFMLLILLVLLLDYTILKYAMLNVPFSPERMWMFRDLLIIPFASIMIKRIYQSFPKISIQMPRFSSLTLNVKALICGLLIASLIVGAAQSGYAYTPSPLSPTPYEIEAVSYIDSNVKEKYVVIGDPIFVTLASGVLGFKAHGIYTRDRFNEMLSKPSVKILNETVVAKGGSVGFFVISTRYAKDFDRVVASARETLGIFGIFGDGNLYVFSSPKTWKSFDIPVEVRTDGFSRTDYSVEYNVNWTRVLFEVPGRHIDPNSVRVVDPNGSEVPSQFDYFQAWFDDCSSSDNWSSERGVRVNGSDGDVVTFVVHSTGDYPENLGKLVYKKFEKNGGDLKINSQKYKYLEIKWNGNYEGIVNLRWGFFYKVGNQSLTKTRFAYPSSGWSTWRYDFSEVDGILSGLSLEFFSALEGWTGDYQLYIDWIRFVSDTGTVRWLYSGVANSVEHYRVLYDFLENTEKGNRDMAPKASYFNPMSVVENADYYNLTWNWGGRHVDFIVTKEAMEWIGTAGKTFSYTLNIDGVNTLTSDPSNRGGLGVMMESQSSNTIIFHHARLLSDGPIMSEIEFETNDYGSLNVRFYQGRYLLVIFQGMNETSSSEPAYGKLSWFISTKASDGKIHYLNEDGEVSTEDLIGDRSWQAQSVSQYEANGYLVLLTTPANAVENYTASYHNSEFATLDLLSYTSNSLADTNLAYAISRTQSAEEIKSITNEIKNPPSVSQWISIKLSLRVRDLLEQPIDDVSVEVKELNIETNTDSKGWAHIFVPQGRWTLTTYKNGITSEKSIEAWASYVTVQKLDLVKVGILTLTLWQFVLLIGILTAFLTSAFILLYRRTFANMMR